MATRPGMGNVRAFTDQFSPSPLSSRLEFERVDNKFEYRTRVGAKGAPLAVREDSMLTRSEAGMEHQLLSYDAVSGDIDVQSSNLPYAVFDPLADATTYNLASVQTAGLRLEDLSEGRVRDEQGVKKPLTP